MTIITLIGLIAFSTASKQSGKAKRIQCVTNLQKLGLAERVFAADHQDVFRQHRSTNFGGTVELLKQPSLASRFRALSNELSSPIFLQCPTDTRTPARDFASLTDQNISYFLGLDANETQPHSFWAGDRNLATNGVAVGPGVLSLASNVTISYTREMHNGTGNVAQGDGSVQQMTASRMNAGGWVGRIVVP